MRGDFYEQLTNSLETARAEGLFKEERIITSAQQADITVGGSNVINFCANNYLGLANHPELIAAAKAGMDSHGFGMASVRFICGTQDSHKALEQKLAGFLGMLIALPVAAIIVVLLRHARDCYEKSQLYGSPALILQDISAGTISIHTEQADVEVELKEPAAKPQQEAEKSSKIEGSDNKDS